MKKLFICFLLIGISSVVFGQSNHAETISGKIAARMKDSLSLTVQKRQQIYQINLQLHQQKQSVRQQFNNNDSIRIKIQLIENTRDSLYSSVLNEQEYILYKQKKKSLVNNN